MSNSFERFKKNTRLKLLNSTSISGPCLEGVLSLWNSEYPASLSYQGSKELDSYLSSLADQHHTLLIGEAEEVLAWYVDFSREDERWFAMILSASIQGKGYGTELLNLAKQENEQLQGWVIDHGRAIKANGDPYSSPLQFYLKNDFRIKTESRLELEKISAVQIAWNSSPPAAG
jgi:GNAT superfamily N-acetyltransferase